MFLLPRLPRFAAALAFLTLALAGAALFLNGYSFPAAQAQTTTPTTVDYDSDDDGLIEISNLAQLNAIRWDLDGDGAVSTTDNANYTAAFPNAATGMGCPDGADADSNPDPCIGYELKADLTFDSNNDGSVTIADSGGLYWNGGAGWTPLGDNSNPYTGEFQGRGKVISQLFINNAAAEVVGLFGALGAGSRVTGLGLEQVSLASRRKAVLGSLAGVNAGTITASYAAGTVTDNAGSAVAGGLVGLNLFGTVQASFASAAVWVRIEESIAGGLVGQNLLGNIKASYASGSVTADALNGLAGGLVGINQGDIDASYARGAVAVSGHNSYGGGLIGYDLGRESHSYWDTDGTGRTLSAGGVGKLRSALQSPTGYSGIYANWNLNLDETDGGDNPWDFGGDQQYPMLIYGPLSAAPQRDYDADNDRLIEVNTLAQLNAIRWDLNGDGAVAAGDKANYAAAFPGATAGMGCPDGTDADTAPDPCLGYELKADLDFDTDGDNGIDAEDGPHWNGSRGWFALGSSTAPFTGTFQGNGKIIANLYANHNGATQAGLFGEIGAGGVVAGVNLRKVNIATRSGTAVGALAGVNNGTIRFSSAAGRIAADNADGTVYAGGLVGSNAGNILTSYAQTEITGSASVLGGLAGHNGTNGSITASYSAVFSAVTSRNSAYLGGLVGHNQGSLTATYSRTPVKATGNTATVGGLVGYNQQTDSVSTTQGSITASYAVGPVVATGTNPSAGGLVGKNSNGTAPYSYWDGSVSGQVNSPLGSSLLSLGNSGTTYTGIYAQWNLNLDGVSGGDDPWLFAHRQYPILKYGGMDVARQVQFYLWTAPVVGVTASTNWHVGEWLTRAPGHGGFLWERSRDGVTGWTVFRNRQLGLGDIRGCYFHCLIEPYEANQRFRVRRRSQERGWVYGYISPPARPWSGPTATLTFASGHTTPRVGQAISISGTDNVRWIRCNDTADNGCDVIVAAATSYTPAAADQGKYLYAYRYYDNSSGVKTMGKTAAIGPVAAATP